jgi:hypothetical protein
LKDTVALPGTHEAVLIVVFSVTVSGAAGGGLPTTLQWTPAGGTAGHPVTVLVVDQQNSALGVGPPAATVAVLHTPPVTEQSRPMVTLLVAHDNGVLTSDTSVLNTTTGVTLSV